jgi:hypothetical protein
VGLRVPESLLREQNELIVELEILNRIRNKLRGKPSKLVGGKVSKSSLTVKEKYRKAEAKYLYVGTLTQANIDITRVRNAIKQLHWKNPLLNTNHFKKTQVPAFRKLEAPTVQEISLTDYQNLTTKSLKMVCKHLNDQVLNQIHKIPRVKKEFINLALHISRREGRGYTLNQIKKRFEIALANIAGIHSNMGRTAFYQLGMALKAYFDLLDKIEFVTERLNPALPSNADFSGEIPILLAFYSIPNNLRKYVARSWNVDAQWVRNTLVGWRRKLDNLLPIEFQIEPLTEKCRQIAEVFKTFARNEEDIKLISQLQGKQVLHLLPNKDVDLSPLLPQKLQLNYEFLRNQITQNPNTLNSHIHSLSLKEFLNSANELIVKVQTTQSQFPATSQPYKNCKTFINKITHIVNEANRADFQEILNNYIIGNRFTRNVAFLLAKGSKYSRLYTALRGIIALTLAKRRSSAIGQFLSAFTPENCLTFPFTSNNREKSHLPVNLLFNKYIVERKVHPTSSKFLINKPNDKKPNTTDIFRRGEPIWLGIPIYSPDQLQDGLLRGKKKGTFWFQLKPSKKIVMCARRRAVVKDIRLNIPNGPTNKIVADVVLSSEESSAFQHSGRFLKAWDNDFGNPHFPVHDVLGSDFNRIGKYMVATANPDEEHDLEPIMQLYMEIYEKLEKFRKWEIPHIQIQLSTGRDKEGKPLSSKKRGRLKTQITLLHCRRQKLTKEMKRQALMLYLYIAWKTKAKYLSWDAIAGISTRGLRGTLAQAITYLPKRKALYDEFKQWVQDLRDRGLLPHYQDAIPVSPFNSQVCAHCLQRTGAQSRTRVKGLPYDEFRCKSCSRSTHREPEINRHSNSSRVAALLLQQQVQSQKIITNRYCSPFPLTTG